MHLLFARVPPVTTVKGKDRIADNAWLQLAVIVIVIYMYIYIYIQIYGLRPQLDETDPTVIIKRVRRVQRRALDCLGAVQIA